MLKFQTRIPFHIYRVSLPGKPSHIQHILTMSTFRLPFKVADRTEHATISLPSDLTEEQLLSFRPFKTWLSTLEKTFALQSDSSHTFHDSPYTLRSITVQAVDFFGGKRIGFLKFKADVINQDGESIPGALFMRGGSVAMLIILRCEDEAVKGKEYVILTVQPRVPAGSLGFVELPAGMIDDSGSFTGAAAKEIKEETGLNIREDELIDMTELALTASEEDEKRTDENHLQRATYMSPGGCDEYIPLFLVRKSLPKKEIEEMTGKLTGLRDHGEKITLKICDYQDVWKVAARDGKTLAAIALYEGLKREGKLGDESE